MATVFANAVTDVAAFCREQWISRKTFYKWRRRFAVEGLDGLSERSRRPHRCPDATPVVIEDAIVAVRKRLADDGADNGPDSIRFELGDVDWQRTVRRVDLGSVRKKSARISRTTANDRRQPTVPSDPGPGKYEPCSRCQR